MTVRRHQCPNMRNNSFVYLLKWMSAAMLITEITAVQGRYAQVLLSNLFETYSSALRPVEDTDNPLNVTLQITLSQIKDVDERNQILVTYLWIRQIWYDAYLKWDKDEYDGLDSIRIPSNMVWRPDIVLYNNVDGEVKEQANTNVVLQYNGKITWDAPMITKSSCVVDVLYFPFDEQQCKLTFGSWTHNGNQIDLINALDSGDLSDFVENIEWEVHGMPAVKNVIMYGCCSDPYPDITYTLILKRKSSFYVFNLLIPCVLICFLAPLGFYLPADSEEKVSLGITILLSLTVFQLIVAESMPPSENVPLIGKYYLATMMMITASTALTIFIMNIHFCGPEAKPVPQWAKVVILDYMSKMLFVYETGESCISSLKTMGKQQEQKQQDQQNIRDHSDDRVPKNVKELQVKREYSGKGSSNICERYALTKSKDQFGNCMTEACSTLGKCDALVCDHYDSILNSIEYISTYLRKQKLNSVKIAQWKKVAKVIDRFFMWVFFVMVFFMTALLIAKAI
ncbi:neuronal acetylcholine receptor subunit alpha-9-like [Protopterus annectens]|uniref:neuronal acetylcholine receptor subunit alpha-9-like n=1 Tax=Protopterus annectens TaxID=7888 RepID=UPI001CFA5239|nr:neuronal acetylcholine receptor subunit alpha-9-like [Protopterus annectens]